MNDATYLYLNNESYVNYWVPYFFNIEIAVVECGYEKCSPYHYWGPDKKDFHIIHYIISGKGTLELDGLIHHLGKGDGFYISPNQIARYQADKDDPWEYRWLGVAGTQANSLFEKTSLASDDRVFHSDDSDFFIDNMSKIYGHSLKKKNAEYLMLGQFFFFFYGLINRFPGDANTDDNASMYIKKALTKVNENYFNPNCNVNQLAKDLNLSRCYLYKLFVRYTGMSPVKYLSEVRIANACKIFRNYHYPVKQVAMMVGYNDATYFSRLFTKTIGQTPSQYLKDCISNHN